ncbi:MAG: group I truncated hemoglobin [Planctomycetaceae bacterium]
MDQTPTLYERLGGETGIKGLLVAFYGRVLADPVLRPFFSDIPMDKLLRMQHEFFAMALDGPQRYTGRQLAEVHHGRGITMAHFHRFQQHLLETLQETGVPADDIHDVIRRVVSHRRDVIG